MEPVSLIVAALVGGATAAAKGVGAQVVKDGYAGLKALVMRNSGDKGGVTTALEQAEKKPDSEARRAVLEEELKVAGAGQDKELLGQAQVFLDLLKEHGVAPAIAYQATVTGSGAIAQGTGAVAAGKGGVAVGGDVHGSVRADNDRER